MADQEDESRKVQYPLDSKCYKILNEIGRGVSAIVYKATCCIPVNSSSSSSSEVAVKSIDLDQSRADFDNVRREAKIVSLLSHPNILKSHCCFTVDSRLWVVMPFMSAGSLQSIIASSFPDGLPEPCIAVILRETLRALCYLHDQGHLHRDVKSGNILMDSDGAVKLADFGVSASIYESSTPYSSSAFGDSRPVTFSRSLMLTDVAGTPYWMAPEVIHSHTGYSFKADIWSFGITAMELAHGRPPLSHLPPSKSLLMRITKQFRFSDYEKTSVNSKKKKFSKHFKEMVGLCLDQDPSKRPSAHKLLKHSFFRYCKGTDFLVKNLLQGLPSIEQRFMSGQQQELVPTIGKSEEEEEEITGEIVKQRRISGWNFNLEDFELNPIFPTETEDDGRDGNDDDNDNDVVKQVRFGGETFIKDNGRDSDASSASNSAQVVPENQNQNQLSDQQGDGSNDSVGSSCTISLNHQEILLKNLFSLKKGLEEQRNMVMKIIAVLMGKQSNEISREEQLILSIEKLKKELDAEKKKNSDLELELEFVKMQFSNE